MQMHEPDDTRTDTALDSLSSTRLGFVGLYLYISHKDVFTIVKALSTALVIITSADLMRFASRRFERTYEKLLGFLMRESEKVHCWHEGTMIV